MKNLTLFQHSQVVYGHILDPYTSAGPLTMSNPKGTELVESVKVLIVNSLTLLAEVYTNRNQIYNLC